MKCPYWQFPDYCGWLTQETQGRMKKLFLVNISEVTTKKAMMEEYQLECQGEIKKFYVSGNGDLGS